MPELTDDLAVTDTLAEPALERTLRLGLAALLGGMTALHVAQAETFEAMIPTWLPGDPTAWHVLATAAEATSAALLARRTTARAGGHLAAATFLGVYVANVEAVRLGGYPMLPGWLGTRAAAVARLPLQVPLVLWGVRVARRAAPRE